MFRHPVNDHIFLKLLELQDAPALYDLIDSGREYLREWLPWVDQTRQVEDTARFIQTALGQFAASNGFQAGILYQGQLAGVVGFHQIDWHNRNTALGYWLGATYQGRGIMTAAVQAMVDIAFNEYHLHRVEIQAAVTNRKSRAIPERLGFTQEGVIRQAERLLDRFVDHAVYGMLAPDWFQYRHSSFGSGK